MSFERSDLLDQLSFFHLSSVWRLGFPVDLPCSLVGPEAPRRRMITWINRPVLIRHRTRFSIPPRLATLSLSRPWKLEFVIFILTHTSSSVRFGSVSPTADIIIADNKSCGIDNFKIYCALPTLFLLPATCSDLHLAKCLACHRTHNRVGGGMEWDASSPPCATIYVCL